MDIKETIIDLLYSTKRDGIDDMIVFLSDDSDFFTAPASTKYHLAYEGGLAEHSLSVRNTMVDLNAMFGTMIPESQINIVALLHDLHKCNCYYLDGNNYVVRDFLSLGRGEKSLYLVNKFLNLSDNEAVAIRFHEGCWTPGVTTSPSLCKIYNDATRKYSLVCLLSAANFLSTRVTEARYEK